jgi:hypothetical protein
MRFRLPARLTRGSIAKDRSKSSAAGNFPWIDGKDFAAGKKGQHCRLID